MLQTFLRAGDASQQHIVQEHQMPPKLFVHLRKRRLIHMGTFPAHYRMALD